MTTYELNNLRKDADYLNRDLRANSIVSETFAAMVKGKDVSGIKGADKAVEYIKSLGNRAINGDVNAVAELNTLRRFVIEPALMEEMKMLSIFGTYQALAYDETVEREVYKHVGDFGRVQANGGDVTLATVTADRYTVPTFTVSGGYAVDYRRVELGDMSRENEGMEQVRIGIRNTAIKSIVDKITNAITNANGVTFTNQESGLTKTNTDAAIQKIRRFGKVTVLGDYALLSEFTPWAGYVGTIANNTITGISDAIINEIAQNGILGMYNGCVLAEMPNPYDLTAPNAAATDFKTYMDPGVGFLIPAGVNSPIATWTRGGLTSFTGNNVHTGKIETRFDLEVACDIAKGHEYKIGLIEDTSL